MRIRISRRQQIQRVRRNLEHYGFPRLQMSLLVAVTGAAGFIASYCLLLAGLRSMPLRYAIAFAIAYVVFLLLLGLWMRTRPRDYADLTDFGDVISLPRDFIIPSPGVGGGRFSGKGGKFGGGGARGSFDGPRDISAELSEGSSSDLGDGIVGDTLGSVADADDLAVIVVVLAVGAGLLFSSVYIIYTAPVLFAELMVDGLLSASLYRRLRGLDPHHWFTTAVRRTIWPFIMTGLLVAAAGGFMQHYVRDADSIGDVFHGKHRLTEPGTYLDEAN